MALLDSLLAFALTLAALATVATLVLEIAFRSLRLKRIGQLRMVEMLLDEATGLREGRSEAPPDSREARVGQLLANPFAVDLWGFFKNLWTYWRKCSAFYEDVSLEHTLRRMVDIVGQPAQGAADAAKEIGDRLEALGVKYDEYCSALAARYKHNAQRWSLVVGVLLAFAMNIDGFRVLEVYLQDPELRSKVITELRQNIDEQEQSAAALPAVEAEADTEKQLEDLQERYDALRGQVAVISGLDLPIGWSYFPACPWEVKAEKRVALASPDPRCPEAGKPALVAASEDFLAWLLQFPGWFLQVLITGLLIGLGAPFWYDVARRLAEVRTAFGGKGTSEQQFRGDDGRDGPWARKQLVRRIVQDFLALGRPASSPGDEAEKPQNG